MKIGHIDNSQKLAATAVDARAKSATPVGHDEAANAAPVEASAKVQLSPAATLLAAEGNTADFDAEKVERIAQAIRDGKFEVNAEAIADKLLAHSRDMLGPRSH